MKTKAAAYIRVSTAEQALHGYSLSAQESLLRQYADSHEMDIVEVYADEGKSASKSLEKRTELLRLVADAEKGRFSRILFKDVTRWSRSSSSYYKIQERLDKCNVAWIAVEQPYLETVTPTGRFQVSVMLGTAQLEAEQTGQRIKFVQESEIRRGRFPFPPHCAPTGYTTEKRDDGNFLIVDNQTAPIVKTIFNTFRNTYNLQRCAEAVAEKHGVEFSETTINRILRNPIYKGEFRGIPDFCEPLIKPELWDALQRPKRVYTASKHKGEYIFSGIAKCAVCGSSMRGLCSNDKYHMYQCRTLHCCNSITQRELEQKVLDLIAPELQRYKVIVKERKADNKKIAQDKRNLLKKKERLTELYLDGIIDKSEFERRRNELESKLTELEVAPDLPEIRTNFSEMYAKLSLEKKAVFWRAFIDSISVHRDRNIDLTFHNAKVLAERMGMLKIPEE